MFKSVCAAAAFLLLIHVSLSSAFADKPSPDSNPEYRSYSEQETAEDFYYYTFLFGAAVGGGAGWLAGVELISPEINDLLTSIAIGGGGRHIEIVSSIIGASVGAGAGAGVGGAAAGTIGYLTGAVYAKTLNACRRAFAVGKKRLAKPHSS